MLINLDERVRKQYGMLYVSNMDFTSALFCLNMIVKKGWNHQPHERRGSIYQQQTAYTTAFVVAYVRPFTRKGDTFPAKLIQPFTLQERECHERMRMLRNTVYAHSDDVSYSVRPWRSQELETDIVRSPVFRLTEQDTSLLKVMLSGLQERVTQKMRALLPAVPPSELTREDLPFAELEIGEYFDVPLTKI